jgi:hypothetical protein
MVVVRLDEVLDGLLELVNTFENAAAQMPLGELGEGAADSAV